MKSDDTFIPNRVDIGECVGKAEMIRRISHYLQIPQVYGNRIIVALDTVIADAVLHGEGISIKNAGTLLLKRHKTTHVSMFNSPVERVMLYKYKWRVSKNAKRYIAHISKLDKEGKLEGFLEDTSKYVHQDD